MKTTLMISLLALSAFSQAAVAGNSISSASFQTTFVVNEACAVQSGAAHAVVNCQFNSPYQVTETAATSSASAAHSQAAQTQLVTVTF